MISVQLWSLRDELAERGWEAVLESLVTAGFEHVEPYAVQHFKDELLPALKRTGLTAPTVHADLTGDQLGPSLEAAAELGAGLVVHAAFLEERWQSADSVGRVAEDLMRAADEAAGHGLRVAFHNHDTELRSLYRGRPALLEVMDRVGPRVGVQFDPNWTAIAGLAVLPVIERLGEKVFALHVKDGPLHGANEEQSVLGEGELDWPAYLAAVGPEVPRVISLDQFRGDALAGVIACRDWLAAHDA